MISLKPNKSPIITIVVIIASIGFTYFILFEIFILFAPCVQKNTPVFSFDLLFTCIDYLDKITLAYLALCLFILLKIKGTNIFNSNGLILSRVIVLIILIAFFIMYVSNLL